MKFAVCAGVLLLAVVVQPQLQAKERILLTRYAGNPDGRVTTLFIARGDGSRERPLLTTPVYEYSASFSRDLRWVVFTSERSGSADIYRVHPDGTGMERLTDDPAFDDQAALSTDGRMLAFVSTRAHGTADIWVLELATRRLRNLTQGTGGNFRPSWSPDGKWLAFSSDRDTEPHSRGAGHFEQVQETGVYVMDADGGSVRRLTPAGVYAGSPKWSPDGKRIACYQTTPDIAFEVRVVRGQPGPELVSQIVSIEVATAQTETLTTGPDFKLAPQYVRDELAYSVKSGARMGLHFTRSGEAAVGELRDPAWSAAGTQVIYQRLQSGPLVQHQPIAGRLPDEFELLWSNPFPAVSRSGKVAATTDFGRGTGVALLRADGGVAQLLSDRSRPGEAMYPGWSPDEQWIVYGHGTFFRGGAVPSQLFLVRPDGTERHAVTSAAGNSAFPSFAPDGRHIVFRYRGGNQRGLRILDLADGSTRILTSEEDDVPAWSPTGEPIAFTRAVDGGYAIFSIRPDGTDLRRLTTERGQDAHGAWSPDGRRLLFASARLGFKDESPLYYDWASQPYSELFVMNADGSEQRPLTDNKWEDGTAAWLQ